jgi:phosphoserine phosphatase
MLELLAYLRANGFKTFIISGAGIEFMRPWAERVYASRLNRLSAAASKRSSSSATARPQNGR